MITDEQKKVIIDHMIKLLELPDSAYEKAKKRYKDLGDWFDRDESTVSGREPHIFPQGSFRLGTAIYPLDESEGYDLDLACKLRDGISKKSYTQKALKILIWNELEAYRKARGIKKELEAKHRCWRLEYQDDLNFHLDIVPCIPAKEETIKAFVESLERSGMEKAAALSAAHTTVDITDDRLPSYAVISDEWKISNPEGYADWFEKKMISGDNLISLKEAKARIDAVPHFGKKTPLQRVIQLLKRHRDNWSKDNPDSKPISIVITTLAARAYEGETDIAITLENVLEKMGELVNPIKPRVPNPVDPEEDFADRWYRSDCLSLRLEDNFNAWLLQAQKDFQHLTSTTDTKFLCEQMKLKLSLSVNQSKIKQELGISTFSADIVTPKTHTISRDGSVKPWQY